ncbi:MAG TPA: hypothetical protein VGF44_07505 [Terriglobales bacterium]|jgi:hypothetical protein
MKKLCGTLLVLLTINSGLAAVRVAGVLFPSEFVYLNGMERDTLSPVSVGDVIRTKERGSASLQFPHIIAVIPPDSVVRVESESLALDTGTISINMGNEVKSVSPPELVFDSPRQGTLFINARDLRFKPTSTALTEFDVTRSNGLISVKARKNSVTMSCGSRTVIIQEGNQVSRADKADCRR